MNFITIVTVIAKHVRKHLGEKSLNELIAQGIAVYLEIIDALPTSRSIYKPTADQNIVLGVIDELSHLDE